MFLQFRFNYKKIIVHTGSFEKLPVLDKAGEWHPIRFLGFINLDESLACPKARHCKIVNIEAYKALEDDALTFLPFNSIILGCLLNDGLYCVLEANAPIVL